ncbi:MAG: sulfite exporter TauE/SafE family protein [Desulfuromonadaceae bacterium]
MNTFFDSTFTYSVLLGFVAQSIGSCLGMAYSVTCSSVLLAMGIPPAMVSATVHSSEVANRLFSGLSHFRYGNVDAAIFKRLALFGALGAFIGAFVVVYLPVSIMRPIIAGMLLIIGMRMLFTGIRQPEIQKKETRLGPLGFIGGLVDVIGGGGWGPVVTSTLVLRGNQTHIVVGSINFAKFFVAVVESATLILLLKVPQWNIIAGLIAGGALAAPLAAWSCRKAPPRALTILVGILVCALSLRTLVKALL